MTGFNSGDGAVRRRERVGGAIPTALIVGVLAWLFPPPTPGAAAPTIPRRAVEPATCPIVLAPSIAERTRCGRLTVPENRQLAGGRTVAINFAVVSAAEPEGARDPLLFVMGGNGSGLKMLQRQARLAARLSRHTDVIFVDHRGSTPWGWPDMSCREFPEGLDAASPGADPAVVAACRRHLDERLDINRYGPFEAAEDLRDLRLALGVPRWSVYGVSYGTTIAQRLLGLDSASIGAIALDGMSGVESNGFAEAFLLDPLLDLLDECAASAECSAAFPAFEQQLGSVAAALEQRPRRIGGELVSHVEYLARLRHAMTDPDRRGRIPLAVAGSARGDDRAWAALRVADEPQGGGGRDPAFTWPGSVCRDEWPRRDDPDRRQTARRAVADAIRRGARLVSAESWDWENFCPRMGFKKSSPETFAAPQATVPALMLVGQLDLVTPPTWSDQVARSMSNARTVVFAQTGHFVLLRQTECVATLLQRFYADPAAPLDTACVDQLPKTRWASDGRGRTPR